MKKICEICDVSQEYEMKENSILVCVSDLDQDRLFSILPELKKNFNKVFNNNEWQQYLEINKLYNRNESKHYMREIRKSKKVEADALMRYETDTINEILNNSELKTKIEFALSTLAPVPKRRFLKHYSEHITYREIAKEENKAVSTIFESIMTARKKFLKNFEWYPEQNTPNKLKFMKGLAFIQLNKSVIKYIPVVVKITSHLNNYAKTHYAERTIIIIKIGLLPIWR